MAAVGFQQSQQSSINFSLSLDKSTDAGDDLHQRIEDFKHQNPEDVDELKKCIQDVLGEAEKTAQERLDKKAVSWALPLFVVRLYEIKSLAFGSPHILSLFPIKCHVQSFYAPLNPQKQFSFSFAERRSEGEEPQCFHVGLERQKQEGRDARSEPRTLPHRHDL